MQRFVQLSHHEMWKGTHASSENAMDGAQNGGMRFEKRGTILGAEKLP